MNFFEHQERSRRQTRWLVFLFLLGVASGEDRISFDLGPINFQPAELAKFTTLLMLATYLAGTGIIADEAAYGRDVGEALNEMAERLDMQDLRFLAVAVTIQQTSGGNLAEILDGLAKVIRSRFKLFRRVRAITKTVPHQHADSEEIPSIGPERHLEPRPNRHCYRHRWCRRHGRTGLVADRGLGQRH